MAAPDQAPSAPAAAAPSSAASSVGAGLLVAVLTTLAGLAAFCVPVVAVWVLSGPALGALGFTDVMRIATLAWAAAQGTPITIGGIVVSLLPFGWGVVPLAAAWLATRALRRMVSHPAVFATTLAVVLGAVGATVGLLASTEAAHVGPVRTAVTAASVTICGALLALRMPREWLRRCPPDIARGVRFGLFACAAVVVIGALGVVVSSVVHRDALAAVIVAGGTGPAGLPAMVAIMVGYLPVAIVWSSAYLLGVGFDFGVLTSPWTADAYVGPVPSIGWVATLPVGGSGGLIALLSTWTTCALVGVVLVRGGRGTAAHVSRGAAAAGSCIVSVAVVGWLATGGFGSGSLAGTGPAPLLMAAAAAIPLLAGVLIGVGLGYLRPARSRPGIAAAGTDGDDDAL